MDAFFAAVEQRDNPELRGKPIAVGNEGRRGVVSTASYEARRYGVHSAMSSVVALRRCPQLIFTPVRMSVYKEISEHIHSIFHDYTDVIEPLSIDEAFLDVTENKQGVELAVDIAKDIKRRIREELNLTASAGVSYNKFLAKIASDYRKPDGLCVIHPSQALDFIARLPVEAFWESALSRQRKCIRWESITEPCCGHTQGRADKRVREDGGRVLRLCARHR